MRAQVVVDKLAHTVRGFARWWLLAGVLLVTPGSRAARLRVVAAAELQVAPRVSPTGAVTLGVHARDDHGQPVRGHVRVVVSVRGQPVTTLDGETDTHGDAGFEVPLAPDEREFHAAAELVGSTSTASARQEIDVDLALPFVTVDLRVPPIIDVTADDLEADVTVHVGEVVPANPIGWPVALYLDDRSDPLVAEVDDTGFHAFHLPVHQLPAPGVVTLRAAYSRHGAAEVRSTDRRVVLRAATRMTLARLQGTAATVVGTLDTIRGPVVHEPVQVAWGNRVVASVLTDDRGNFVVDIDPDVASQSGVVLQARFTPGQPWYVSSQSPPVAFSLPEGRPVSWRWVLIPVGVGLVFFVLIQLVRRDASEPKGRVSIPSPLFGDVAIERVTDARSSHVRIVVHVEDNATHKPISNATIEWRMPSRAASRGEESVELPTGSRFECVVKADGYAPRVISADLPRAAVYHVRVPLRSWREELFERARAWMRRAGAIGSPALPTPREVLQQRSQEPGASELVGLIEKGTYGPQPPDASVVAAADDLERELEATPQRER